MVGDGEQLAKKSIVLRVAGSTADSMASNVLPAIACITHIQLDLHYTHAEKPSSHRVTLFVRSLLPASGALRGANRADN